MKITHIIVGLGVGGAELMLKRLVEGLDGKEDMQHSVISLTGLGPIGEELQKAGIDVTPLGMKNDLKTLSIFFRLREEIKRQNPDIVQTWMYHADFLGGLAARSLGINKIIWGIRTTDVTLGRSKLTIALRRLCAPLSFHVPKIIISASEAGRKVHELVGYDGKKMQVIPNGFYLEKLVASAEQRRALRDQCEFSDQEIVIGSIGRFNLIKNQRLFIEAAALISTKFDNARFLMIGRDNTWDNTELVDWINQYGMQDKFVLLGERSDIPVCLAAMDIFCLHSKTEGFPNVLGEAMAMALPCVATDVGDSKLLLGETGKIVSIEASSICNGVTELLELDKSSLGELGIQARYRLRKNYSLAKIIAQYSELYRSII